jgi:hypothetical protein
MPTESSRTRSVRRITAPGDTGTYVDLKVIDDITFTEQQPPYQEWVLGFKNNSDDAARTVHVVEVGDDKLKVERIDTLNTAETTGRAQEAIWSFLNNDDPPVHLETHETTIYASDGNGNITDTGTWIKVQRIDKIEFSDSADEVPGQEYVWNLDNPDKQDSQDDYKNLTAPLTYWDNSSINPPWRLDPFQTIVDAAFSNWDYLIIGYSWQTDADLDIRHENTSPIAATVGYGGQSQIGDFVFWGTDNTGNGYPYEETVYYDLKKAREYKSDLIMNLKCFWYNPLDITVSYPSISPVTIKITLSRGGSINLVDTVWTPTDAKKVKTETITISSINQYRGDYGHLSLEDWPGQLIGTLTVSPITGKWKLT